VLVVTAVEETELLLTVGWIVGGINIRQDLSPFANLFSANLHKPIQQSIPVLAVSGVEALCVMFVEVRGIVSKTIGASQDAVELASAHKILAFDEEACLQQAYEAMLEASLGFMFSYGFRALAIGIHCLPDFPAMTEQQKWFAGQPDYDNYGLSLASDNEAYAGYLGKARELTKQSVNSAIRGDSKETGAIWHENAALREATFGNVTEAKQAAGDGLKLTPTSQGVDVEAALAYAMTSDTARAESTAQDLNKRFPLDTQAQALWLPAIRAEVALDRKNPAAAIEGLQAAVPLELGQIQFVNNISCLYPTYIRGEAFLAAGQGKPAAAEFQKIPSLRGRRSFTPTLLPEGQH
jgi:hypothetical protein